MLHAEHFASGAPLESRFTGTHVEVILRARGWLAAEATPEQAAWCERAATLLGPHAENEAALADWLGLVFDYDARNIIANVASHVTLSRYAARDVLRRLAPLLLDGPPLDSDRFKEVVTALKNAM